MPLWLIVCKLFFFFIYLLCILEQPEGGTFVPNVVSLRDQLNINASKQNTILCKTLTLILLFFLHVVSFFCHRKINCGKNDCFTYQENCNECTYIFIHEQLVPEKMRKSVKVDECNSSGAPGTTKIKAFADTGGAIDDKIPHLLKLLIGLCIGQMIMVIGTAATLGVFVNANTKEIDELKQSKERLNAFDKEMQIQKTKVAHLETSLTQETTNIQLLSSKLAQLETESETSIIKEYNASLTDLGERIIELESETFIIQEYNASITDLGGRITELESNITIIQEHNNSLTNIGERITELESDTSIIQEYNATLTDIGERITELESDTSIIQEYNATLTDIGERITDLESGSSTVQNISHRVTELELDRHLVTAIIQGHNSTLTNLGERITDLESDKPSVQNISDRVTQLELDRNTHTSIMQEYNASLTDLVEIITELESGSSTVQNISDRVIELEMNRNSDTSTIQEYNATLQGIQSRLTAAEEAQQRPSYAFYAYMINTTIEPIGLGSLTFTETQLDEADAYNNETGKYTAQVDGIYIFQATLCTYQNKYMRARFGGGGTWLGTVTAGDRYSGVCSTGSATARLQKGDQVSLIYSDADYDISGIRQDDTSRNSFSGHLISL